MKAITKTKRVLSLPTTLDDFKNALLIVSVLVNLFILTTWLVILVSPDYSLSLVSLR